MIYNNITAALRVYCREQIDFWRKLYDQNRGREHYAYRRLEAIAFSLEYLTDQDFPSFGHYKEVVYSLLTAPKLMPELPERHPEGRALVDRVVDSFVSTMDGLQSDCPAPPIDYRRQLYGEEAQRVKQQFADRWGYRYSQYWYPLTREDKPEPAFFVMWAVAQRHLPELEAYFAQKGLCYEYGEDTGPLWHTCAECEVSLFCAEVAHAAKDFSWMVYCSHEMTIAFVGSIVPDIQRIMADSQKYWNIWWADPAADEEALVYPNSDTGIPSCLIEF